MLESIPFTLLAGFVLGTLSGMGVGGGSLLMLWLTLVLNMDYDAARTVNLLFFIPSALIASWFHRKQGTVQYRKILPAMLASAVAAAIFSLLRPGADSGVLRTLFGILLLFTGIKELFYRPKKAK